MTSRRESRILLFRRRKESATSVAASSVKHFPIAFCARSLTFHRMSDVKIGLIGGSGLGDLVSQSAGTRHEVETPFGKPSGAITEITWAGLPVLALPRHGAGHVLNPSQVPYRANIFALKQLGCTHILASGAVGSLRQEFKPRDLVVADQVIDKTFRRAGTFYDHAAVHVEFAEPFCGVLRQILIEAGKGSAAQGSPTLHERGCYLAMEGPAFSTRAESLMHRLWGGDLVGMTAMPEAKLAREAEIPYAMIALVTDYDSWKPPVVPKDSEPPVEPAKLLEEIIGNLSAASTAAMGVLKKAVELIAADPGRLSACKATDALKLAIWSDKSKIDPAEVQRLAPLWLKYFEREGRTRQDEA
ncbi:S-methyl-5'-thioadenosine phosphorylase [soil metagenome]